MTLDRIFPKPKGHQQSLLKKTKAHPPPIIIKDETTQLDVDNVTSPKIEEIAGNYSSVSNQPAEAGCPSPFPVINYPDHENMWYDFNFLIAVRQNHFVCREPLGSLSNFKSPIKRVPRRMN